MAATSLSDPAVGAIRAFNRFYTRQIGLLNEGLLDSGFSLTQVRILYELAHRLAAGATELAQDLNLDPGYLSRILQGFASRGLIRRKQSKEDGRQQVLSLTAKGSSAIALLETRASAEIAAMLERLEPGNRTQLVAAMKTIERLLDKQSPSDVPYILRPPHAGDFGWVVARHGALYAQEFGWDESFEALVAEIVAKFIQNYDLRRERCLIAEREGLPVGSVFLVKASEDVAKLRLLLVEPKARGLGIGRKLVAECIRFARNTGYKKITLWTNDVLQTARRIYESEGFRLVQEERRENFGKTLTSQTWERDLPLNKD